MKSPIQIITLALGLLPLWTGLAAQAQAPVINGIVMAPRLTIQSATNLQDQIQYTTNLGQSNWTVLTNLFVTQSPYWFADLTAPPAPARYYRVLSLPAPSNMVSIPGGSFIMGDTFGDGGTNELPVHPVTLSSFSMDSNLVVYALWHQVYQWAATNGYSFDNVGSAWDGYNYSKGSTDPVYLVNWYDAVKWCNARSEMQSLTPCYYTSAAQTTVYRTGDIDLSNSFVNWNATGYRLPTEAEWEAAARGGSPCHRFPWSDTNVITWSSANYCGDPSDYTYDLSSSLSYDPAFSTGVNEPYTSPVGSFPPNGYGLYDMAGNLWEWCWDWYAAAWYSNAGATQSDPRGPSAGDSDSRVLRGGSWYDFAGYARCSYRGYNLLPTSADSNIGFRCVSGF
jgi:formylglycine-generating enzyme required for sulfatase activity